MDEDIPLIKQLRLFCIALFFYFRLKITLLGHLLEKYKNWLVKKLLWRRGILSRPILHFGILVLATISLLASGVIGGASIVAGSYPGVADPKITEVTSMGLSEVLGAEIDAQTTISEKPRDQIITYKVQSGDTLSSIAKKFDIDVDTIKWANNLSDIHNLSVGQELKILPVSGVSHVVKSGESVYSIAKKYQTEAQPIVDFPFNDIGEDLALKAGQTLIVPGGVPPQPSITPRPVIQPKYFAQEPSREITGSAGFIWPTTGVLTQNFSWYHPGIDLANPSAPNVIAADGGRVTVAGYPDRFGYGNRVIIDHGNGYTTLYAHLAKIYVSVGQQISRGQALGQMGSTGRSTGTHLHLEIRRNGVALNPFSFLK